MNCRNILLSITTVIALTAFASAGEPQSGKPPLNLIPMYGYPDIEKPEALKRIDEEFIKSVVGPEGSREEERACVARSPPP